jgi:general stress protein CsbA
MLDAILAAIANSPIGLYVAEDPIAFPWIETGHVLSLVIVFGSILLVDLRLMGLASRDYPVNALTRTILPVTWVAFVGAAITGGLLFASNPYGYVGNSYFLVKMGLLLLAGVNMLVFHVVTQRSGRMDTPGQLPGGARLAGFVSAILWIAIIACGRWIGFTMAPF